ncbi:hypothetical protein KNV00_gp061 [Streptomyces phage Bmoc]|uniref:Uncharacterized protein n=1 Tax=Streptomyces phage Bmoc TaxID=2725629 RepID=A0A6M3T0N7_9CAUD|nr:hypothetical protein KNV00_gp061 [Streptomyces phage Bmoc]QJD50958.1 hypothetical protein SEA_BMOC_250 [Streptomyces phage Bmoc]
MVKRIKVTFVGDVTKTFHFSSKPDRTRTDDGLIVLLTKSGKRIEINRSLVLFVEELD